MSKSLQEQLLAAGLVDKKRAAKIDREKRKKERDDRHHGKRGEQEEEAARKAALARQEKARRDRELELKKREKAERKSLAADVRQLVLGNRVDRRDAEIAHQFVHGGKIKKVYVNATQHKALARGDLCVVRSAGKYDLVAAEAAAKIRLRDPAAVIDSGDTGVPSDDADEYKDFEVPDDLMW